jgi:hypothetical protein
MKKELESELNQLATGEIIRSVTGFVFRRWTEAFRVKTKNIVDEVINKPFGRFYLAYHLTSRRIRSFAVARGWVKEERDSLETEFDRRSYNSLKEAYRILLEWCEKHENGNTHVLAVNNGKPCLSALGAYVFKSFITKHEFNIKDYPYSPNFVGNNIPQQYVRSQREEFLTVFEQMFIPAMGVDRDFTLANRDCIYSVQFLTIARYWVILLFQNAEGQFFMERLLTNYMRLVYLEQKKIDVNTKYINDLKKRWEDELVQTYMLGFKFLGLVEYAGLYKSLPLSIRKRVPTYNAKQSAERRDSYVPPTVLYGQLK